MNKNSPIMNRLAIKVCLLKLLRRLHLSGFLQHELHTLVRYGKARDNGIILSCSEEIEPIKVGGQAELAAHRVARVFSDQADHCRTVYNARSHLRCERKPMLRKL